MKKLLSALIFFSALAGAIAVWWKPITPAILPVKFAASPEEILSNDFLKVTRNLKPENTEGDEWKKINTYNLTPESLVTKNNAATFFKTAQNNLPDIYGCLKKDFCGMTTRGEDDAYFDDQKTPAHILMNRSLKVLKESLRKDDSLIKQVDWELIHELARSEAAMIQVEALDILKEFDSEGIKTSELIKLTEDYHGSAKAEALLRLSRRSKPADKLLLAGEIEEVFAMADSNTVISVLENVNKMALGANVVSRILKNLCRFKENINEAHNWSMIKYVASQNSPDFEKNCN